jgi:hypothetical protein
MQQSVRQRGISGKVAVAVCAALLSVLAGQAVAGGFKSTCKHISLESPVTLRALCRIGNSGMNQSTILDLDAGLSNDSGTLKWGGRNFSQSCKNIKLQNTTVLTAECLTGALVYGATQLDLNDRISNDKGDLKFD